jgi:hypothetical protein
MLRNLLLICALIAAPAPAFAVCHLVVHNFIPHTTSTEFIPFTNHLNPGSTEGNSDRWATSVDTIFSNLSVWTTTAPGSGKTWTLTLRIDASDETLTCVISNTETTCDDFVNEPTISAGALMTMSVVPSGTPTASALMLVSMCMEEA